MTERYGLGRQVAGNLEEPGGWQRSEGVPLATDEWEELVNGGENE